ncbi:MAG TPA: hypothetical protein VLB68_18100 [Pyrinomonadaceae bacterium]|nr:hypothetical protein [Pyrinomonadaceae bacterium]
MAYKSGEFTIPGANFCGAATVFNNTLFILNTFGGVSPGVITFDLTKLKKQNSPTDDEPINGEALTNPANWVVKDLTIPWSNTKPALVSFEGAMYSFVNHGFTRQLSASRYSLSDDTTVPGTWSPPITLLESDGKTVLTPNECSDLSATTVGDNIIILACGHASSSSNSAGGTFVAIYDTRDLDTSANKWVAKWHDYLPNELPDDFPLSEAQGRMHVSVEWFSTVDPNAQKTDPPAYFVGVFVQPEVFRIGGEPSRPVNMSFYRMSLGEQAGSEISITLARALSTVFPFDFFANLIRDPAGRLRSWISENGKRDFQAVIFQVTVGDNGGGMGLNPASGESITVADDPINMPFSLFYVFSAGQSDATVNGQSTTQYPVYEFVFYGRGGQCQVNRCGTIEVIPDFSVRKTKEDLKIPLNVISGIIDGPMPVPLENFKDYDPGPGETNAGSMIYGLEKSKDSSHKVSNKWSLGFESQGKMTTGVGPAWDISFKGGMGSEEGDSSGTTTSYDLTVDALITASKSNNDPSIVPDGVLRAVGVQFSITAFRYLDNFGPAVDSTNNSATNGLKAAMVTQSMVDESVLNFKPYMVTPGKLESYTPEAINATMKGLGYTATPNYFGDVIMTNAYPFTDPTNPYLGYSWSKDGTSGQSFSQWAESFQETSWNLDLHAYGGVSGTSGVSVFGEGAELEWDIMAGIDYSHDSISDTDKKSGWSIGLGDKWGPPSREDLPESVSAYDFRIYFLPVPVPPSTLTKTYWTTELITQTKQGGIDGNSGCWRVVYVVTRIEHVDGSNPYHYDGKLDVQRSVYKVSDESGSANG